MHEYVRKGGLYRSTVSARRLTKNGQDVVASIKWTSAPNVLTAYPIYALPWMRCKGKGYNNKTLNCLD